MRHINWDSVASNVLPCRSIDERTIVHFQENSRRILQAYVDSGEGLDRAGGFAAQVRTLDAIIGTVPDMEWIQGMGGILLKKIDGDWWNVVGFPAASFFKFIQLLIDEEDDFLSLE